MSKPPSHGDLVKMGKWVFSVDNGPFTFQTAAEWFGTWQPGVFLYSTKHARGFMPPTIGFVLIFGKRQSAHPS